MRTPPLVAVAVCLLAAAPSVSLAETVTLAKAFDFHGFVIPAAFYPGGRLEHVELVRDAVVGGIPCRALDVFSVSWHPDGSLRGCTLVRPTVVAGAPQVTMMVSECVDRSTGVWRFPIPAEPFELELDLTIRSRR